VDFLTDDCAVVATLAPPDNTNNAQAGHYSVHTGAFYATHKNARLSLLNIFLQFSFFSFAGM